MTALQSRLTELRSFRIAPPQNRNNQATSKPGCIDERTLWGEFLFARFTNHAQTGCVLTSLHLTVTLHCTHENPASRNCTPTPLPGCAVRAGIKLDQKPHSVCPGQSAGSSCD